MQQKISIQSNDPVVLGLLPGYIKHRALEIFQLQRLLQSGDFEKIRIIGHNLKGSGGLYGLPQISEFGASLEHGALSADQAIILDAVKQMESFIEQLEL